MQPHKPPAETVPGGHGHWYGQPVVWLGVAILLASLAGCVWMIVLGARYADVPIEGVHPHTVLDMPVHAGGNGEPGKAKPAPGAGTRDAGQSPGGAP